MKPIDSSQPFSTRGDLRRSLNQGFPNDFEPNADFSFQKIKEGVTVIRAGDNIILSHKRDNFPLYSETEEFQELLAYIEFIENSRNNFEIGKYGSEKVILVARNYDRPAHAFFNKNQKKRVLAKLKDEKTWPKNTKRRLLRDAKLWELSYDPLREEITLGLFQEAETMLEAQEKLRTGFFRFKLFTDIRRTTFGDSTTVDFILYGHYYDKADAKRPVSKYDNGNQIPRELLMALARDLGQSSITQKAGSEKCLHIVDLRNIPSHLKKEYKRNLFKGAIAQGKIYQETNLEKHIFIING